MEPASQDNKPSTPVIIGRYRVVRLLGQGKLGAVYLVRDDQQGRLVSLKTISPKTELHATEWRRFGRAVQAACQFHHESSAQVYEYFTEDNQPYIALEFIEGQFLDGILRHGTLPQERVVPLALQLASVIRSGHSVNIEHRGLEPRKIVIQRTNLVKILDFGLDGRLPRAIGDLGDCAYDVQYLSPEQARGERLDYRTDFFSLGTLLYEMVTRKNPFTDINQHKTLANIQHKHHEPLAQSFPGVHAKLSVLVDWLLQKDPERRPEDAQQIEGILRLVAVDMNLEQN